MVNTTTEINLFIFRTYLESETLIQYQIHIKSVIFLIKTFGNSII